MKNNNFLKLVIADDQDFFRKGFMNLIEKTYPGELKFIADVSNGELVVEAVASYKPDIVITDVQMPVMDGINACKLIKMNSPLTPVIAMSMFTDTITILSMIYAGANGFFDKSCRPEEIIEAVRTVSDHENYYCSVVAEKVFGVPVNSKMNKQVADFPKWEDFEIIIMKLLCKRMSVSEIAQETHLEVTKVEYYRQSILQKTAARDLVGVALFALVNHII